MVGRGAFGNPWFFRSDNFQPSAQEKLKVMLEHAKLFEKEFFQIKSFVTMRKHFKAYASGFLNAPVLREKLMQTKSFQETEQVTREFLNSLRV